MAGRGAATHPYAGMPATLATKHGKEHLLARPLRAALGLTVWVPSGLDTDALGTFSGEVPRVGTPLDAVWRKVRLGLATACPSCGAQGWGIVGVERGLPCAGCGMATDLVRTEVMGCAVCELRHARPRSDGRQHAPPERCPACNP